MPKIYVKNKSVFQENLLKSGLSMKRLSHVCGISQTYMSMVVNGKKSPSGTLSKKILEKLDVKFDDIFFIS